jgi:SAM-dependent methyltransferase
MAQSNFLDWLRRRRRILEDSLTAGGKAYTLSLARYRLHRKLSAAIEKHAKGHCLDAGSGRSPYKKMLLEHAEQVTSVDVEDRSGEIDLVADLQSMPQLADASFDTVLCSQVLEHVPRPWDALSEIARVLRPDGVLIATVPHLSVIHEAPHDYFRYTQYGLASLCERAKLRVICIEATGGLWCFLLHGGSGFLLSTVGSMPFLRWPAWLLNYLLFVRLGELVDRMLGLAALYPCDFVLLATRTEK